MRNRNFVQWTCIVLLGLSISSLSGCEPLKKKFIRQKKKDKQAVDFVPVLTPIDYAEKKVSSEEKYKYHFGLWRVWERDLMQVIEQHESDKRQKYLLDQVIIQLVEIQKLLSDDQSKRLDVHINELNDLRVLYQKPELLRNISSLKRRMDHIFKKIRHDFSPGPAISYKVMVNE